jgi:hypothetical protein
MFDPLTSTFTRVGKALASSPISPLSSSSSNHFNFNKLFAQGIPFFSREKEAAQEEADDESIYDCNFTSTETKRYPTAFHSL